MSKNLTIVKHDLTIKEYKGHRVITFKDIDTLHERPDGTAGRNFRGNKEHFIENTDYFKICADEIRRNKIAEISDKAHQDIVFITESGYLMLAKSLTDDLAWQVQRELVNNYFRVKAESKALPDPDKQKRNEIYEKNVRNRAAKLWLDLAKTAKTETYKNIMLSYATKELAGEYIIPLPESERKTYSATEIGQMFGKSSNLIGRLANEHNLKTEEYGQLYHDKSRYSAKEVDSFRYYDTVIPKFKALLGSGGNA